MALEPLGIQAVAAGVPGFVRSMGRMDKGIQTVGKSAVGLSRGFADLGKTVLRAGAVMGAAIGAAAVGAGAALAKLAIDAAPLEGVRQAFDGLAESAGIMGDEMLENLEKGSAGLISQRDLMISFNKAASLVSLDFATQLPNAMELLGKVALATGQDLGFLLDSLVVGVGRVSPMILDNLGIQVSLAEATERAAEMFGVQASELSKTQQQAGVMAITMEKLEAATADIPPVVGSASQIFGSLGVQLQNLKDQIGLAILPVFRELIERAIQPLVERFLPDLIRVFQDKIVPVIGAVVEDIGNLVATFLDAGFWSIEFKDALSDIIPFEVQKKIEDFATAVRTIWEKGFKFFVDHEEEILGVIKGIATALAISGIIGLAAEIAGIFAAIGTGAGAVLLIVAGLALAWTQNWFGIQEATEKLWNETLKPFVDDVITWFREDLPPLITKFRDIITQVFGGEGQEELSGFALFMKDLVDRLRPLIENVSRAFRNVMVAIGIVGREGAPEFAEFANFIKETVLPILLFVVENFIRAIENMLTFIANALDTIAFFWLKHGRKIQAFVLKMFEFILAVITGVLGFASGILDAWGKLTTLQFDEAFEAILGAIGSFVFAIASFMEVGLRDVTDAARNALLLLGTVFSNALTSILQGIKDFVTDFGGGILDAITGGVDAVADFLGLGSPSRLMQGIGADMMAGLARGINQGIGMPTLALQAAAGSTVPAAAQTINMEFNQNIQTRAETEPVAADFQQMVAQAESVSRRF